VYYFITYLKVQLHSVKTMILELIYNVIINNNHEHDCSEKNRLTN